MTAAGHGTPSSPLDPDGRETLVSAARVLTGSGHDGPGWVRWRAGVVLDTGPGEPPVAPDAHGALLTPGLVDIHCHGGGGASFTDTGGADAAATVARTHLLAGTTALLASLVSAPVPDLVAQLTDLTPRVEDGTLAGIHLEGPWLSPHHPGAHDPTALAVPTPEDVARLLDAGRGHVRMVTLAPELPGALDAIRTLSGAGVAVAIGHTAADADTVRAAADAGARVVTHLANGMPPLHHRSPGPVPAMLADPRLTLELIADGVHVDPQVLALFTRAARGPVALVSDAMAATAAPDGDYLLGSVAVRVRDGVARTADGGSIAGSTLTLDRAVRVAVAAGIPLPDAVASATTVPARAVGLDAGTLTPGARADAVLLDADLRVQRVWRTGHPIVSPDAT